MFQHGHRNRKHHPAPAARYRVALLRRFGTHRHAAAGHRARRPGSPACGVAGAGDYFPMSELKPVHYLDLSTQSRALEREWLDAIREAGSRGSFILGPHTQAFEKEFAE